MQKNKENHALQSSIPIHMQMHRKISATITLKPVTAAVNGWGWGELGWREALELAFAFMGNVHFQ